MLAVSLTFLAAAFILGPELLSRWVLGIVVPQRSLSQNRGEQITRAIVWAMVPLGIVVLWVRLRHVLGMWGGWYDFEVAASGLYSGAYFDAHRAEFYRSLAAVSGMVWSLLWRLYLIVILAAIAIDWAILHYRWLRNALKSRWAKTALATLILPRVSEWYVLLSDMLLPTEDVMLEVDVLTKNGTLYQGGVQDRMIGADGSLQSLTLADPRRFLRDEFHRQKEEDVNAPPDYFWRRIPGKLFVILGTDIASVNVRYTPRQTAGPPLARPDLSEQDLTTIRTLLSKLKPGGD
ncbi:MAG TPA: hypothetical protein VJU82_03965 [Acidobacteriaceae bacterium]|nr:hypothetical protein [Acidobacteriaceae bacterium]